MLSGFNNNFTDKYLDITEGFTVDDDIPGLTDNKDTTMNKNNIDMDEMKKMYNLHKQLLDKKDIIGTMNNTIDNNSMNNNDLNDGVLEEGVLEENNTESFEDSNNLIMENIIQEEEIIQEEDLDYNNSNMEGFTSTINVGFYGSRLINNNKNKNILLAIIISLLSYLLCHKKTKTLITKTFKSLDKKLSTGGTLLNNFTTIQMILYGIIVYILLNIV